MILQQCNHYKHMDPWSHGFAARAAAGASAGAAASAAVCIYFVMYI